MAKRIENLENLILVCTGSDCRKRGAKCLGKAMRQCVRELGKRHVTHVVNMRCCGLCQRGPIVCLQPDNTWITHATADVAVDAVSQRLTD